MYFRLLDSISDRARIPPKFSLIFQRLEENSSPARSPCLPRDCFARASNAATVHPPGRASTDLAPLSLNKSAIDQNEPWRLRAYFLCELPGTPGSIAEAYDSLKPQQVRDAESAGVSVRRQGDIFLIRLTEKDWNPQLQYGRDTLAKNHRLWGGTHRASTALITNGRVFVSGKLTHERREHRIVFFKGAWYEAVKNTALQSWNAVGYVD